MAMDFRCPIVPLVKWIKNLERNGVLCNTVDVRLQGNLDVKEIERLLKLGLLCTRRDSKARPTMRQITHILDGDDRLIMSFEAIPDNSEPEKDPEPNDCSSLIKRMQALGIQ